MLKETAERYPAHTATRMYQHTLTYQELYHSVRVFAGALQKKGLKRRSCSNYAAKLSAIYNKLFWHYSSGRHCHSGQPHACRTRTKAYFTRFRRKK